MVSVELSRQVRDLFREYQRYKPPTKEEAFDQAQIAILNIIDAVGESIPPKSIITACGDAKSPNAVSRALRHRLSPKIKF